jgi:hypothetical protein
MCVRVFIGVSAHTCISIYIGTVFLKKFIFLLFTTAHMQISNSRTGPTQLPSRASWRRREHRPGYAPAGEKSKNQSLTRDDNGSGSGRVEQLPARQQRGCG